MPKKNDEEKTVTIVEQPRVNIDDLILKFNNAIDVMHRIINNSKSKDHFKIQAAKVIIATFVALQRNVQNGGDNFEKNEEMMNAIENALTKLAQIKYNKE